MVEDTVQDLFVIIVADFMERDQKIDNPFYASDQHVAPRPFLESLDLKSLLIRLGDRGRAMDMVNHMVIGITGFSIRCSREPKLQFGRTWTLWFSIRVSCGKVLGNVAHDLC